MGNTSSEKLLINKNKDLIYDQYTCTECNLVPKILRSWLSGTLKPIAIPPYIILWRSYREGKKLIYSKVIV